jgi:membrane protein YdbS with pleckstrin-like domain
VAITEQALLESGFTAEDLQKLKHYTNTQGSTLDVLLPALANRFMAMGLLSAILVGLFILAVCFSSSENIISFGVAVLLILGIFCWMTPLKLTYKAWRFKTVSAR